MDKTHGKKTIVRTGTSLAGGEGSELSWQEEMVVRMTQGLSETADFALEFRGAENAELRARLALIEADLLAEMHGIGPLSESPTEASIDHDLKNRIANKLASLGDE